MQVMTEEHHLKAIIHYNLAESEPSLCTSLQYRCDKNGFHEQNRVLGLGYTALKGDNWAFTPFWFSPNQPVQH